MLSAGEHMSISRRDFIGTTAISTIAATSASGAEAMPKRTLGKTGEKVSILVFGSGSRFLMYKEEEKALEALNKALDMGITYIDTAYSYGNGTSEERVGKVLKARGGKKGLFLATKVQERNGEKAMRIFEGSLKRLNVSQVDLLHIHGLMNADDLAAIEAEDGVLKVVQKIRDQKMARFIGITCHHDPMVLKTALERHEFDCTQMALNAARAGMRTPDDKFKLGLTSKDSFESIALPVARRKNMGVIAMKVFGQEGLVGKAEPEQLIRYSLSIPGVSACVAGMPKLEHIEQNITIAKNYKPLAPAEMQDLSKKLERHKMAMDLFFHNHVDA
jgi:predicted aldo/keto reductase-like oxidoreductase